MSLESRPRSVNAPVLAGLEPPTCFVIMPFVERDDRFPPGFFSEVYGALFEPAVELAGFRADSAQRIGTEMVHTTIVRQVLDAPIVLADLTGHNLNVGIELGMRLLSNRPVCVVKARGTEPVFNLDVLRWIDYDRRLWSRTVADDIPRLAAHLRATWEQWETQASFLEVLYPAAPPVSA